MKPVVATCAAEVTPQVSGDVMTALASPADWEGAMVDLVGRFGECVVDEAVRQIVGSPAPAPTVTAALRAQVDPIVVERGRAWLAAHGG